MRQNRTDRPNSDLAHDARTLSCASGVARDVGRGRVAQARRGFSLVDLLVSISLLVVLIAILLPSLAGARLAAQKVVCASNVRQIGLATQLYADDYRGMLPPSIFAARGAQSVFPDAAMMMAVRMVGRSNWDGLGLLYVKEYLNAPGAFYCPAHTGESPSSAFANQWSGANGIILSNYQYRGGIDNVLRLDPGPVPGNAASSTMAIVTDGLATRADFNHRVGANTLRVDLSVVWFSDPSGSLAASLPANRAEADASTRVVDAWRLIDKQVSTTPATPVTDPFPVGRAR